jgi:hypothetical protein
MVAASVPVAPLVTPVLLSTLRPGEKLLPPIVLRLFEYPVIAVVNV